MSIEPDQPVPGQSWNHNVSQNTRHLFQNEKPKASQQNASPLVAHQRGQAAHLFQNVLVDPQEEFNTLWKDKGRLVMLWWGPGQR